MDDIECEGPSWSDLSWFTEDWEGDELPVGPAELDDLEALIGGPLPAAFRELYLRHNGGWPIAETGPLHGFAPIKHGALPIERLWVDARDSSAVFAQRIPFATDQGGNLFALHIAGDRPGAVSIFLAGEDRWMPIASSFEELLRTVPRDS